MGVLQANKASPRPFSMNDVEQVAKSVLLKARLQAENLIAGAMEEAERMKEEARQAGLAQGLEEGRAQGAQQGHAAGREAALQQHSGDLQTVVQVFTEAISHFETHRRSLEAQATRDVVQLSVAIARRVIKRQAAVDSAVLEANLGEAMRLAVAASDLRIAVHPRQREVLNEALPRLRLEWPDLKHVELVDDETLEPGGCRVYTRNGCIDADLMAQLDRIATDLLPDAQADAEVAT